MFIITIRKKNYAELSCYISDYVRTLINWVGISFSRVYILSCGNVGKKEGKCPTGRTGQKWST